MAEVCSLAVLECLIQSSGCLRLEDLWAILLTKFHQCSDVLSVIGPTVESLEQFIRRQPALFQFVDGCVYSADIPLLLHKNEPASPNTLFSTNQSFGESFPPECNVNSGHMITAAIEPESQAVKYFQEHLLRKPERWIPIKRLAGHLSQASPSIRTVVGPQSEFINFLLRHPLFFRVQGDLVGLSDNIRNHLSACVPATNKKKLRPVSYQEETRRRSSFDHFQLPVYLQNTQGSTAGPKQVDLVTETIALSVEECKALLWLRDAIDSTSEHALLMNLLLSKLSHAPKCVHGSIGWTQIELKEFINKYNKIFSFDEASQIVQLQPTKNINLVIVTRNASATESNVLLAQRGCIFCINRLWGIIDLGFHEHVFFDRSLFKHVTDLSKHFQVKETVFFNAVLATKESRAKWRATCVWKETDPLANYLQRLATKSQDSASNDTVEYQDDPDSGLDTSEDLSNSKPSSMQYLFEEIGNAFENCLNAFASIRLADAWEIQSKQASALLPDEAPLGQPNAPNPSSRLGEPRSSCSSPVSELSTLSGVPSITGFGDGCSSIRTNSSIPPSEPDQDRARCSCSCGLGTEAFAPHQLARVSVATQTLFTGDIMATKLYHGDVGTIV